MVLFADLLQLIMSYFGVVKREMIDMVPKAVMLNLVGFSKDNLQKELLEKLYTPEALAELLKEAPEVTARRKEVSSLNFLAVLDNEADAAPLVRAHGPGPPGQ